MLIRISRPLLGSVSLALCASCSNLAGPEYARPAAPVKSEWSQALSQVSASETIRPDWWTSFGDPYLNDLVRKAIADSIDIKILAARIEVARASIGEAEAGVLPTFGLSGGAEFTLGRAELAPGVFSRPQTTQRFNATGSVNWEIDVWGRLGKGVNAQQAEFKATEADWRAGYLTLVADVASAYFEIRQFDEQSDRQNRALDKNRRILAIHQAQYREGLAPKTQVLQQEAEVSGLQQELLELARQRKLAENRLATLLGIPAGELRVPTAPLRGTVQPVEVPIGLPSELLTRRPDIIAAEYRVLRAHELTGQARLARLPSVSLTGNGGFASAALSALLKGWTLGLAPAVNIPIFDPSLKARVRVREAETRLAEEEYRRTVIQTFEEVENTLVNLSNRKAQQQRLEQQLANLRLVNSQIRARLEAGLVSQLEVFESERSLLAAEQALLRNHQQILADTVTLYKALGGGWPKETVALAGG